MATQTMFSLAGATVTGVARNDDVLILQFAPASIYVSLTGSDEQTEWREAGELVIEEAEVEDDLPDCPCTVRTGDVYDNGYVYRDMVPLPLDSAGQVGISWTCAEAESKCTIRGNRIRLKLSGDRKYVRHLPK